MNDFDRFLIYSATSSINASNNRIQAEVNQLRAEEAERFNIAQQQAAAEKAARDAIANAMNFYRGYVESRYDRYPMTITAYNAFLYIDQLNAANASLVSDYGALKDYQMLREELPRIRDSVPQTDRASVHWVATQAQNEYIETRAAAGILRIAANLNGLPDYNGGAFVATTASLVFAVLAIVLLNASEVYPFPSIDVFTGGFLRGLGMVIAFPLAVGMAAALGYWIARWAQKVIRRFPDKDLVNRLVAEYNIHERFRSNPWLSVEWITKYGTDAVKLEEKANAIATRNNAIREQLMGGGATLAIRPVCTVDERVRLQGVTARSRRRGVSLLLGILAGAVAVVIYLWLFARIDWRLSDPHAATVQAMQRSRNSVAIKGQQGARATTQANPIQTPEEAQAAERKELEDRMIREYFESWARVWWAVNRSSTGADNRADYDRLKAELERSGVWAMIVPPQKNRRDISRDKWLLAAVGARAGARDKIYDEVSLKKRKALLANPEKAPVVQVEFWRMAGKGQLPSLQGLAGPDNRAQILEFIQHSVPGQPLLPPMKDIGDSGSASVAVPAKE
jgi:hypothetical protein